MTARAIAAGALLAGLGLAACATPPTGPSVMVLPGSRSSFEEFQADDAACRDYSAGAEGQRRYDTAYMQCMYAKGHQIPLAVGGRAPAATALRVPPPPEGAPPDPPPHG